MGSLQQLRSGSRRSLATVAWAVAALVSASTTGCSFVLDSSVKQCTQASDCDKFGSHPACQDGVCVASGLGPPDCVLGVPKTQSDFLNACTTSKYAPFDNCDRLKLCDPNTQLPPITGPMVGKTGATAPPPAPTNLCVDGAPGGPAAPKMIWLYGSSDFGPLLRAAQPSLTAATTPYRAVFQGATSCQGVTAMFDSTKRLMKDPAAENIGGWAFYFDAAGNQVNCRIDPLNMSVGVPVDIGISNLYPQTCGFTPSSAVTEYTGPVVPFVFAVKAASSEQSISVEAAHLVFGNGGMPPASAMMKNVAPWTDYTKYFIRNNNAGSTVLTALLIGVDQNKFWGIDRVSTDNLRDGLLASSDAESAIGILSIDFYDKNRGNLKALYLKAKNQSHGYQPDSTPTTIDKANVRDGHYPLWGYVHFVAQLNALGSLSDAANAMVLLFNVPRIEQRLVDEIISASLTPQCAMKVARNAEIGDFSVRKEFSCGCYFDFKTKGKSDCKTCMTAEDCTGQSPCNYGFCEAGGS